MNSFFNSEFNYRPLVWIFHGLSIKNKIKRLEKDRTVSKQVKNMQILAIETFKTTKNFFVPLMRKLFQQKVNNYDLRNPYEFSIPTVNSVFHGQKNRPYLVPLSPF